MEELKLILIERWPEIVSYAATLLSYFFIFLYRSKVNGTKNNMVTLFKESSDAARKENKARQKEMLEMKKEYEVSKQAYEEAIQRIARLEETLKILVVEEDLTNDEEN